MANTTYTNLTVRLPLKPGCAAAIRTYERGQRTVFLYQSGALIEMIDLAEDEAPVVELLYARCRPGQWGLVSDWRPEDKPPAPPAPGPAVPRP